MRWLICISLALATLTTQAAERVPEMYRIVAFETQVPAKLFYALILNESRSLTSASGEKKVLPWPWTINHRGTAHFFPTRTKAHEFAQSLVDKGDKQFDVGLGQLNWYWQEDKFKTLWDAFDPYENLHVAASFFREQYLRAECNTWELAIGCYHRPGQRQQDKQRAKRYTERVKLIWSRI